MWCDAKHDTHTTFLHCTCCIAFGSSHSVISQAFSFFIIRVFRQNDYDHVVVVTRLLPKNGDMAEDHGALKANDSPGPGPENVEMQRVAKERAALRVRSWTDQNEMRGDMGRMTASAA